jgi:hypothetical protein
MISAEEWWSIIGTYGARIWPAQVIFYIIAILLTGWLFLKPGRVQNWLTKLYLSIVFAWNGIVFGHHFASLIIPGAFPCPTTALGLLLLTTALPRVNKIAYFLLLLGDSVSTAHPNPQVWRL